jgi:hypothetical protein
MPTAARLLAALALAATAWIASDLYKAVLPEGTQVGKLSPVNAVFGLLTGWIVLGRLTDGSSYLRAVGHGIRGGVTVLFWALLFWSLWRMLLLSMQKRYSGPAEAIDAFFDLIARYAMLLTRDPAPAAALLAGGILSGLLAEWAARRYR